MIEVPTELDWSENIDIKVPVGGFSFMGVDIKDVHLHYAPENKDTYLYRPSEWKVDEQIFDAHDGGFYYGTTTEPKDITLRCYYEQHHVKDGVMFDVYNLFKRGNRGKLVFRERPWLWYDATVYKVDTTSMFNYQNGLVVITMRCYFPFGKSKHMRLTVETNKWQDQKTTTWNNLRGKSYMDLYKKESDKQTKESKDLTFNTNMQSFYMPILQQNFSGITSQQSFYLYNPGAEKAKVAVEVNGTATQGFTIANSTTGQILAFNPFGGLGSQSILYNSTDGKTYLISGSHAEFGFIYHNYGSLELAPAERILRDVKATYTSGSQVVTIDKEMKFDYVGYNIYINGKYYEIISIQTPNKFTVNTTFSSSGVAYTDILKLNKITVTPNGSFSLNSLKFKFIPTFA